LKLFIVSVILQIKNKLPTTTAATATTSTTTEQQHILTDFAIKIV